MSNRSIPQNFDFDRHTRFLRLLAAQLEELATNVSSIRKFDATRLSPAFFSDFLDLLQSEIRAFSHAMLGELEYIGAKDDTHDE